MKKIKKVQTGIRFPVDLLKDFKEKAQKEYMTVTAKMIQLMTKYVNKKA